MFGYPRHEVEQKVFTALITTSARLMLKLLKQRTQHAACKMCHFSSLFLRNLAVSRRVLAYCQLRSFTAL